MEARKGMGVSEIFVFILAALTFAVILLFGIKAIANFIESGEEITFVQLKNDLEGSVKRVYSQYGAIRIEEYHVSVSYKKICLVDMNYKPKEEEIAALCQQDPRACNVWQTAAVEGGLGKVEENIFLSPTGSRETALKVYSFTLADAHNPEEKLGFLCLPITNGQFTLVLEGKGDHTEISQPLGEK